MDETTVLGFGLDEYQSQATETFERNVSLSRDEQIDRLVFGVVGEAGEVAEKRKKYLRGDYGPVREESTAITHNETLVDELGDVLWYVAVLADELGVDLSTVAEENVLKLRDRDERDVLHGSGDDR